MLLSVEMESPLGLILRVLSYLLVGILLVFIARRFHISLLFAVILVAGILFRFVYVQETTYDQRGHDIGGHLAYVRIIAEQHHIPSAGECWTCYHPPLYYEISALPWNFANFVKASPQRALPMGELHVFTSLALFRAPLPSHSASLG